MWAILVLNNEGNTGNFCWLCSVHVAAAAVLLSVRLPKCSTKQQSFLFNIVKSYSAFGLRMGVLQARGLLQTGLICLQFHLSPSQKIAAQLSQVKAKERMWLSCLATTNTVDKY